MTHTQMTTLRQLGFEQQIRFSHDLFAALARQHTQVVNQRGNIAFLVRHSSLYPAFAALVYLTDHSVWCRYRSLSATEIDTLGKDFVFDVTDLLVAQSAAKH